MQHRTQNTAFKKYTKLLFISGIFLLIYSCNSDSAVSDWESKNQEESTTITKMTEKIQNFITAINNNLETRNSEKTDVAEAENIIEGELNLKYTKV